MLERARRYRWFVLIGVLYLIPVLVVSRFEVVAGAGQFPQGTNALNEFLFFSHWRSYPLQTWYSPFTDWGVPASGYTGPTILYAGALTLDPSTLVRVVELASLWLSGLSAYALCRNLGAHPLGAGVAGFFYLLQAETPQLSEGHVPFMISAAIAPVFLLAVYRFGADFRLRWGLLTVVTLYLLASIGGLDALYFLLFFSVPLLVYSVARHRTYRRIGRSQVFAVGCSLALFLAAMAPWWVPFLAGARPQYTTSITSTVLPFGQLRAEPLSLAYVGISLENSFTRIALGQPTWALDYALLAPLYFVVPAIITLYVVLRPNLGRLLLYGAGVLAILISTGPNYPGIATFNGLLYDHVPYFDYIPAVSSWLIIAVIVYTLFVGWLVTDLVHLAARAPHAEPDASSAGGAAASAEESTPRTARYLWNPLRRMERWTTFRRYRRPITQTLLVIIAAFIVVSVTMEDVETFTSPPQLFQFPEAYISGYQYIGSQPLTGGTLTVPFGTLYERTPWGGVSGSSELMSTYFANANAVVFEAGTPYSLAMDQFINTALTNGMTTNLTKFLAGTNVQFVTATDYPDWAQAGGPFGPAPVQYQHLPQQSGLGAPVYSSGYQTVYEVSHPAGNLSFHRDYFLYFGDDSLVNEITNQPFYDGTEPLLNGSSIEGSTLSILLPHAAGVIVSPKSLSSLTADDLSLVTDFHIPIVLLAGATDLKGNGDDRVAAPWNASNARAVQLSENGTSALYPFDQSILTAVGHLNASASLRASCTGEDGNPVEANLTLENGPARYSVTYVPPSMGVGSPFENLPIPSVALSGSSEVGVNMTSECRLDTIAFTAGSLPPTANTVVSYLQAQPDPLAQNAVSNASGWGLLLASQTFSTLWRLTVDGSPASDHVVANLGLNAWLVDLAAGQKLVVSYLAQEYQAVGIVVEGAGVLLIAAAILVSRSSRLRARFRAAFGRVRDPSQ